MKITNYNEGYFNLKNNAIIEFKPYLLRTYSFLVSLDFKEQGDMAYSKYSCKSAKYIGISLQRHISLLKQLGYISVKRRDFNMTNIYTMIKDVVSKVKEAKIEAIDNFKKQFITTLPKPKKLKFDNFQGRDYSEEYMEKLEKQLLGWE